MGNSFCIMRMEKIRTISRGSDRLRHNRREIPCKTSRPGVKNVCLNFSEQMREDRVKPFKQIFDERAGGQKLRKNAIIGIEVVLTFSPGAIAPENIKPWAMDNAKWLRSIFGNENIIDCQLHLDEETPHIHALVIPIDERGKLNSRAFIGGSRNKLSELQTDYFNAMAKHGLRRGISRDITKAHHESSLRWHAKNAENEARLQAYETVFGDEQTWDFDTFKEFKVIQHDLETQNASEGSKTPPEVIKEFER